jgi:hypothetical protein
MHIHEATILPSLTPHEGFGVDGVPIGAVPKFELVRPDDFPFHLLPEIALDLTFPPDPVTGRIENETTCFTRFLPSGLDVKVTRTNSSPLMDSGSTRTQLNTGDSISRGKEGGFVYSVRKK